MEQHIKQQNKLKQFWNWLWNSDSIWSWIVSLALAFIIVKFIFFPLLSFSLGTSLPLVVVESSSMEHPQATFIGNIIGTDNSFEAWWKEQSSWYESRGITEQQAQTWDLKTGFDKGDIMLVYGRGNIETGDVIIFEANTKHPIIHRIISVTGNTIQTKGDNNAAQLDIEKNISESAIVGKAVVRIPKLGWLKLIFVELANSFR